MSVSVGQQLRQARTELQVSLKDISQVTKIQPWVLEALEADRLHATMSPVYVKSFLTTYAKHLRLDPYPFIAQLFPEPAPPASPELLQTPQPQRIPVWAVVRRLIPAAIGIASLIVLVRLNPVQWLASGMAHRAASVSMAAKHGPPRLETTLKLEPAHPLELGVAAHRPTWVSVNADGKLIAQQQLAAGEHETWKARRKFEVIVGTPSKVEMTLNGHSISPLAMAHHGRLIITHTSIKPLERVSPARSVSTSRPAPQSSAQAPATAKLQPGQANSAR